MVSFVVSLVILNGLNIHLLISELLHLTLGKLHSLVYRPTKAACLLPELIESLLYLLKVFVLSLELLLHPECSRLDCGWSRRVLATVDERWVEVNVLSREVRNVFSS